MKLTEHQLQQQIKAEIARIPALEVVLTGPDMLFDRLSGPAPDGDAARFEVLTCLDAANADQEAPVYRFQQAAGLPEQNAHANDFLALHEHEFMGAAYRYILGRTPDSDGLEHYLGGLHAGTVDKTYILGALRYSREGRARGATIQGLLPRFLAVSLLRVPVLGHLIRSIKILLNLPGLYRYVARVEGHQMALQTQLKAQLDEAFAVLHSQDQAHQHALGIIADQLPRISRLETAISALEEDLERHNLAIGAATQPLREGLKELQEAISSVRQEQVDPVHLEELLRAITADLEALQALSPTQSPETVQTLNRFYQDFEDRFRGSRETIKERAQYHLWNIPEALIADENFTVLDLGCGRGEWLELLGENGVSAVGVDFNEEVVSHCVELGLTAYHGDALKYLKSSASDSVSVITAFHIVEHIPFPQVIALLDECYRVLRPGGQLVLETPDPENLIVGASTFYTDPTHLRPLPPPLLSFTLEQRGYTEVEVAKLHPFPDSFKLADSTNSDRLNYLLFGCQDYAVTGKKA